MISCACSSVGRVAGVIPRRVGGSSPSRRNTYGFSGKFPVQDVRENCREKTGPDRNLWRSQQ